ncbi:hypothetical protein BCR42DRAFT_416645 [Absidia repens]|uniref:ERT1/acuK family PAS domain-containing protein n=1 Tax=Absidia repens TaxID=90262 RepID=A0A1X2IET8_9FUNG|nr:hypothetical protein BCR42DRAFT_416645 [Absidia repens]
MNPSIRESHSGDQTLKRKRRKVSTVCIYCGQTDMTFDDININRRPCQRCLKLVPGNNYHDELGAAATTTTMTVAATAVSSSPSIHTSTITVSLSAPPRIPLETRDKWAVPSSNESVGNEVDVLNEFLTDVSNNNSREHFYLTAADPKDGNMEDRLNEVVNAKYKAGFLKPYNYVNGYARLQRYMDQHMSPDSRHRILNVMGTFRPTFRDVAQSLTDVDLILVEEAFDRLLLDYDRVFSAMSIPACLWRRTGEIYKGNKEFATLIDVSVDDLRNGRLCIYEIMAEESVVNYWEKYGNIGFDARQKAVLTSCLIRHQKKSMLMSCCFSFTIRRDKFNMTIIVGNFLPIQIQN